MDEDAREVTATHARCKSTHGSLRCDWHEGHRGAHRAEVGRPGAVLRWGMVGYGCPDPECIRKPGHSMPHRDGKGMSWVPLDADDDMDPYWTTPPRPTDEIEALRDLLRLISADMHNTGTRPCGTCSSISKTLDEPFGCVAFVQRIKARSGR